MYLLDRGDPGEFMLFVNNFNMTLAAIWILGMDARIHYIRIIVHGEALC